MNSGGALIGYTDRLSVAAGDRQRFMISAPGPCESGLVRIICGEAGARFAEEPVRSPLAGRHPGGIQILRPGSWGRTGDVPPLDQCTICIYFLPTQLTSEASALFDAPGGITLLVSAEGLRLVAESRSLVGPVPLVLDRWHWLCLRCDRDRVVGTLRRYPNSVGERMVEVSASVQVEGGVALAGGRWLLAARAAGERALERFFNGRIELPWIGDRVIAVSDARHLSEHPDLLASDARVVAAWDFSKDISSNRFLDLSRHARHGTFFNTPTRAVRGTRWNGSEQDWRRAPSHYAAVHFHEDDITAAGWKESLEWHVPSGLPSGVYAVKLTAQGQEDYVPFVVRPSPQRERARVVFLMPTATYLAYANARFSMYAALLGLTTMSEADAFLHANPGVGPSLYERHTDGSGVHYSSYLRPVRNLKPKGKPWCFTADTNIVAWLHHCSVPFDVVTDEDLHREGSALLDGYHVLITGTHPEYASTRMLDALEEFLAHGGRLMYMGGNGFYWRVAYHPDNPAIIELRRAEGRGRAWDCDPAEYYHSFTGEYGGLWRLLGRPPNRLTGVGFSALAHEGSTGYRRQPGADDPRARFIFNGTSEGELFGAYGTVCGGAVSQEIDRANPVLGTPAHTLILASSENHPSDFILAREEADASYPESVGARLRADLIFFETPAGGAVFSTGSIGFAGALSHQGYVNDVCRIATNVLERFADPTPFSCASSRPDERHP